MARLALRAALRGQRLVGAAYGDRAAAEAKRARRAAEHAGGYEEEADAQRAVCWAALEKLLMGHQAR